MWSISNVEPYEVGARPYSCSTACFSESGTFRIELVWKLDEQSTVFVRPR